MSASSKTRLLVVDDDRLLADAVLRVLRRAKQVEVLGVCFDAATAEAVALDLTPDVVLMDVMMPGLAPWKACRRITGQGAARVLFCTGFDRQYFLHRAITAGASGVIAKGDQGVDSLVSIVRRVAVGDTCYSPAWQRRLDELNASGRLDAIERLTLEQVELAVRLAAGDTIAQAADRCGIGERAAYRLVDDARHDLGCSNARELLWRLGIEQVVTPEMMPATAGEN